MPKALALARATLAGGFVLALFLMANSETTCDIEVEKTLKTLLLPQDNPSIQLQALRRDMARRLQQAFEEDSKAQWEEGALPSKRNLEALARAGYIKTSPEDDEEKEDGSEDADSYKRSLSDLAQNGQLPASIGGRMGRKRASARTLYPVWYGGAPGKRFVGSLARGGELRTFGTGKRNVAALLRQDDYLNRGTEPPQESEKRNIGSIKAQYPGRFRRAPAVRPKRQTPFYTGDNYPYEGRYADYYDDGDVGVFANEDKRFLGRLPQMGKTKTTPSPKNRYH